MKGEQQTKKHITTVSQSDTGTITDTELPRRRKLRARVETSTQSPDMQGETRGRQPGRPIGSDMIDSSGFMFRRRPR